MALLEAAKALLAEASHGEGFGPPHGLADRLEDLRQAVADVEAAPKIPEDKFDPDRAVRMIVENEARARSLQEFADRLRWEADEIDQPCAGLGNQATAYREELARHGFELTRDGLREIREAH